MVKIRLKRIGRKGINCFRIIVVHKKKKRNTNSFIMDLGYYQPNTTNNYLKLNVELYKKYLNLGAQPTERVQKLYNIASKYDNIHVISKAT